MKCILLIELLFDQPHCYYDCFALQLNHFFLQARYTNHNEHPKKKLFVQNKLCMSKVDHFPPRLQILGEKSHLCTLPNEAKCANKNVAIALCVSITTFLLVHLHCWIMNFLHKACLF